MQKLTETQANCSASHEKVLKKLKKAKPTKSAVGC